MYKSGNSLITDLKIPGSNWETSNSVYGQFTKSTPKRESNIKEVETKNVNFSNNHTTTQPQDSKSELRGLPNLHNTCYL